MTTSISRTAAGQRMRAPRAEPAGQHRHDAVGDDRGRPPRHGALLDDAGRRIRLEPRDEAAALGVEPRHQEKS